MVDRKVAEKKAATRARKGVITERKQHDERLLVSKQRLKSLIETIQQLAQARDLEAITAIIHSAARTLIGADGSTFVLRDGDQCFYMDENAIRPLWKGQRFPMNTCISGWVIMNHQPAVIEDIYADARIPAPAYRPTFVKSLAMVPIRTRDPIGAIGNYWAVPHLPTPEEVQLLQTLADAAAIAMENIQSLDELRQEITERIRAEETLGRREAQLNDMGRIAAIGGWEFPLVAPDQAGTDRQQVWTDEVYRIHEVDRNYSPTVSKGIEFYAPASRPIIERAVQNAITKGEPFDVELEFITAKGNQRWVHAIGRVDRERAKVFGIFQDITERKRAEQALQTALAEKDVLLREIHHRVKNTLQMTSALLELQSGYVKDEQALAYFKDSQQRIQSMAMVHAQLYHSQSLAQIDFTAYLHTLVDNLRGQYAEQRKQVKIRVAAQACILPVDTAIPCGLVITELVSNAMKHAFPEGRAGELRIGLQAVEFGKVVLEVTDDGVGLPPGLDIYNSPSFGLRLIRLMVEDQLDGKLTIESNRGTRVVCEIGEQK